MEINLDKKAALADVDIGLLRTKGLLAAGRTPAEVYRLYSEKFQAVEGMTPELLTELRAEVKGVIALAWPEVRKGALINWATERDDMKRSQGVLYDSSRLPAVADQLARMFPKEG